MGASPAPVLTSFEGGRALSDFRAVGLLRRLRDRVPTITAVSYTHLDVYTRQQPAHPELFGWRPAEGPHFAMAPHAA